MPYAGWPVNDGDEINAAWLDNTGLIKVWDTITAGITFPVASVTTPTLPTGFTHLFVVWSGRCSGAVTQDFLAMRVDGSSLAAYYMQRFRGQAATASAAAAVTQTSATVGSLPGTSAHNAADFAGGFICFPSYQQASSYMDWHAFSYGVDNTTTTHQITEHHAGYYGATVLTSMTWFPQGGSNFAVGTSFHVYGMA